jgi:hypothetical protein
MKKFQTVTTLAVAGSTPVGVAAAGASVAGASQLARRASLTCSLASVDILQELREDAGTDGRPPSARHVSAPPGKLKALEVHSMIPTGTVRTVSDESFSITRLVTPMAGSNQVVFFATNLQTGELRQLNGTVEVRGDKPGPSHRRSRASSVALDIGPTGQIADAS